MKIILIMTLFILSAPLWGQSVSLNIRLHSIFATDDVRVECVQQTKTAVLKISLKTVTTDYSDIHLTIPYRIRSEEYLVNNVPVVPGEPHLLFRINRGVSEHLARVTVRKADFNICEAMGELVLTSTPR